jgi:hypothetical protein
MYACARHQAVAQQASNRTETALKPTEDTSFLQNLDKQTPMMQQRFLSMKIATFF